MACCELAGSGQNWTRAAVVRSGWDIISGEGRPIGDMLSAIIVASVPVTARSCHAPSVERRGSWILELHDPYDAGAMPSLPDRRRMTSCSP